MMIVGYRVVNFSASPVEIGAIDVIAEQLCAPEYQSRIQHAVDVQLDVR